MMITDSSGRDEIRVMDFGIAKLVTDTEEKNQNLTKTGEALGSPLYMSPEQARGENTDYRSDLYSLGCVMYESLTGVPPLIGQTPLNTMMAHLNEIPVPLRKKMGPAGLKIEASIEQIVMTLLEKDREDRYQSMELLLADLQRVQAYKPPVNHPKVKTKAEKRLARRAILIGSLAACLIISVVGSYCYYIFFDEKQHHSVEQAPLSPDVGPYGPDKKTDIKEEFEGQIAASGVINLARLFEGNEHADLSLLKNGEQNAVVKELLFAKSNLTDQKLEPIKTMINVRFAYFERNELEDLDALADFKKLQVLSLESNKVSAKGISIIQGLPELVILRLRANDISNEDLPKLSGLSKLLVLDLTLCPRVTADAVATLQKKLPNCMILHGDFYDQLATCGTGRLLQFAPLFYSKLKEPERSTKAASLLGSGIDVFLDQPERDTNALADLCIMKGQCELTLRQYDKTEKTFSQGLGIVTSKTNKNGAARPYFLVQLASLAERKDPNSFPERRRFEANDCWKEVILNQHQSAEPHKYYVPCLIENFGVIENYYETKKLGGKALEAYETEIKLLKASQNYPDYRKTGFVSLIEKRLSAIENHYNTLKRVLPPAQKSKTTAIDEPVADPYQTDQK